jgi:hypothetical protein
MIICWINYFLCHHARISLFLARCSMILGIIAILQPILVRFIGFLEIRLVFSFTTCSFLYVSRVAMKL